MAKSFEEAVSAFELAEEKLNRARHRLFAESTTNLFRSEHFAPYEENISRYFFDLNRLFEGDSHAKELEESLGSMDSHRRRAVLQIIEHGFFSDKFMTGIARKLLMLGLEGVEDDLVGVRTIFARKYDDKSLLISLLPGCIVEAFNKLDAHSSDAYYVYQNAWYSMWQIGAVNQLKDFIFFGENHENVEVRELAAEYKDEMNN